MTALASSGMTMCIVQVDALVKEATSLDNLAVMYEGWAAWI